MFNGLVALLLRCHEFEDVLTRRMSPNLMNRAAIDFPSCF